MVNKEERIVVAELRENRVSWPEWAPLRGMSRSTSHDNL